ncbi:MAG: L-sorbosone dehydrogenase [Planctomycetaceae bacterium]|nr:MAG: L-sorbosone dehydrogenase [Planctomycetaceae bacterium]
MKRLWRNALWSCFTIIVIAHGSAAIWAQRDLREIPPPDPELERQTFVLAEGLEVNLFAADPAIHKPIQLAFDPQGRLWIAASEVYPQIAPGQQATDKILLLEDLNGDGVADKTTVFADGLLIPTGVLPGDGGVYVANSTELLHLKDTDGDGRADQSRIVLSGFGTEDTHHIIHTFRWGPDGLFYFNQSIYIHSHVETPYGVRRLNAGGIWQFRPETLRLEVFARGWINSWGHAFDRWGQSFVTDGAGFEGINYLIVGGAYPTAYGAERVLHGLNPGSPKYCGLEIIENNHFPAEWQGNLITHDFRGHRVCRFVVSDQGSGFMARQLPDVISSQHVAFRPVDVRQGPDGALYIADWYNPIIQHGEVDFRDPRRDHVHGRIWRVTYQGRPLQPRQSFVTAETTSLLHVLQGTDGFAREQARRVLKERGALRVIPEVERWWRGLDTQDPALEHHLLEALWLYQALDVPEPYLLQRVLQSSEPRARAAAVRVVAAWGDRLTDPLAMLAQTIADEYPRVRLETVRALAQFPNPQAATIALRALQFPLDDLLDYALWLTLRELKHVWVPAALAGDFDAGGRPAHLAFAVRAVGASELVPLLVSRLDQVSSVREQAELLETIGSWGNPDHLQLVFQRAVQPETSASEATVLLQALLQASDKRRVKPAGMLTALQRWLAPTLPPETLLVASRAAAAWQVTATTTDVQRLVLTAELPLHVRLTALRSLFQLDTNQGIALSQQLVQAADQPDEIIAEAFLGWMAHRPAPALQAAVRWLQKTPRQEVLEKWFASLLQSRQAPRLLAASLKDVRLPPDVAKLGLRAISGSGRSEPELEHALRAAGDITDMLRPLTDAELSQFIQEVRTLGDPARGEAVYRRSDLACQKCHAIAGAGGAVGPDLRSLGTSAQLDYLLDSLLFPSKNIKEGYQTLVVQTDDGRVLSGIKSRETDQTLFLRDAEGKELAIPKATIEAVGNGTSLMPAGLTEKLTHEELVHLVRFLSELGKPGPWAVSNEPWVRRWLVLVPTQEAYTRLTRTSDAQLLASDEQLVWQPVYTTVSGELPLHELPLFETQNRLANTRRRVTFLRIPFRALNSGSLSFQLNPSEGVALWLDGQPLLVQPTMTVSISAGEHKLSLALDRAENQRPTPLKLKWLPEASTVSVE